MNYLINPLKRLFDFKGRANRKEFWLFMCWYIALYYLYCRLLFRGITFAAFSAHTPLARYRDERLVATFAICTLLGRACAVYLYATPRDRGGKPLWGTTPLKKGGLQAAFF